jgi:hypothetical protein
MPPVFFRVESRASGLEPSIQEHPNESRSSTEVRESSDAGRVNSSDIALISSAPAFGEGNTLLTQTNVKDAGKKRKPKNNMTKSNSSFISRVIVHETLHKRLGERPTDGIYGFANINRAFQWLDLSSRTKVSSDSGGRLLEFVIMVADIITAGLSYQDSLHQSTLPLPRCKSSYQESIAYRCDYGILNWRDHLVGTYISTLYSTEQERMNPLSVAGCLRNEADIGSQGIINGTPVSEIRWIPGSEHLFLAAHMDGSLVVYDKEKEDALFTVDGEEHKENGEPNGMNGGNDATRIQINKSVYSKNQKTNPVAVWKLSNQRINAFAFSPDNRHLAVVSEDGTLRIIDYLKEE